MSVITPPPPRKGDQLFRGDLPDWHNTALLNEMQGAHDPWRYAEGYKRAAGILVRHVQEDRFGKDLLVYPIIFLYRHHLELALKRIIRRSPKLLARDLTPNE